MKILLSSCNVEESLISIENSDSQFLKIFENVFFVFFCISKGGSQYTTVLEGITKGASGIYTTGISLLRRIDTTTLQYNWEAQLPYIGNCAVEDMKVSKENHQKGKFFGPLDNVERSFHFFDLGTFSWSKFG